MEEAANCALIFPPSDTSIITLGPSMSVFGKHRPRIRIQMSHTKNLVSVGVDDAFSSIGIGRDYKI